MVNDVVIFDSFDSQVYRSSRRKCCLKAAICSLWRGIGDRRCCGLFKHASAVYALCVLDAAILGALIWEIKVVRYSKSSSVVHAIFRVISCILGLMSVRCRKPRILRLYFATYAFNIFLAFVALYLAFLYQGCINFPDLNVHGKGTGSMPGVKLAFTGNPPFRACLDRGDFFQSRRDCFGVDFCEEHHGCVSRNSEEAPGPCMLRCDNGHWFDAERSQHDGTSRSRDQGVDEIKDLPQCQPCKGNRQECAEVEDPSDHKKMPPAYFRLQESMKEMKWLVRVMLTLLSASSVYFLAIISRFMKRGGVELQDSEIFGDEWTATEPYLHSNSNDSLWTPSTSSGMTPNASQVEMTPQKQKTAECRSNNSKDCRGSTWAPTISDGSER